MKRWLVLMLLCASSSAFGNDLETAKRIHKEAIGVIATLTHFSG